MFRKKKVISQPLAQQAPQMGLPGPNHLRTSFRATFPDGQSFEYFILPGWQNQPPAPFLGKVVQSLPHPATQGTVLKNAAARYLEYALGCVDGLRSADGDFEAPILFTPTEQEALEKDGIDLFEWVFHECKWEPRVFRDQRLGHRRVADAFGLKEELQASMHGVLRHGLWQSTYHLTDKALYVFGESHEQSCARFPLELFVMQTKNPPGTLGPGNHLMYFVDPGNFDFGTLPENSQRGPLTSENENTGFNAVSVAGFHVVDSDGWEKFSNALARTLPSVLPTERFEISYDGRKVACLISKTIVGKGTFCFEDLSLPRAVAVGVRNTNEFKEAVRSTLASMPTPAMPSDISSLRSVEAASPTSDIQVGVPNDVRDRLDRLVRLRDDQLITEDEYLEQRQRILGEL